MTVLSAGLFFGFVVLCVARFNLLSCYSAYGPFWMKRAKYKYLNAWTGVTFITAALLVPVMITAAEGSGWQFTGFLCPALIAFVAITPDYGRSSLAGPVHSICAGLSALLAILYVLCVVPRFWWTIVVFVVAAALATAYWGKYYWCFWFEMAAFATIFTTVFLMIRAK